MWRKRERETGEPDLDVEEVCVDEPTVIATRQGHNLVHSLAGGDPKCLERGGGDGREGGKVERKVERMVERKESTTWMSKHQH